MKYIAVLTIALLLPTAANAADQYRIDYKLYRTVEPDEERPATESTEHSAPLFGIIEGDYLDEDAGFSMDGDQLVHQPADSNVERRYDLVSSPSLVVNEGEAATIQIGEQVPYQDLEEDADGKPAPVTKYKDVGTTVNAVVRDAGDGTVTLKSNGKFVTLVDRQEVSINGRKGDVHTIPVLDTTAWESEIALPLGAWSYQRVGVTQGHEFLIFARVRRFDPEAKAEHEQYTVEAKLLSVPIAQAERLRKMFEHDDAAARSGDDARVFRVNTNEWPNNPRRRVRKPVDLDAFVSGLWKEDVELLSAPRMTLGHSSLAKIVLTANHKAGETPTIGGGGTDSGEMSGITSLFGKFVPHFNDFFNKGKPYFGVISDFVAYRDPGDGRYVGFDGFVIGAQVDPLKRSPLLSLDVFFQHQFNTGGKEGGFLNRSEPYTFENQMFRFPELTLQDGGWLGIEFVSKQTGDLMLLLVQVAKVIPSEARAFEADTDRSGPARAALPAAQQAFSSLAIPDDVDAILDVVPQIDGRNVHLHTELLALGDTLAKSLHWADIVVPDKDAAVIGFDIDRAETRAHLLGVGSKPGMPSAVSSADPGTAFHGVAVPEDMDFVAGITPQIEGDNIRLWFNVARKGDSGKLEAESDVWTNVIVKAGDSLTLGLYAEGGPKVLGIRPRSVVTP